MSYFDNSSRQFAKHFLIKAIPDFQNNKSQFKHQYSAEIYIRGMFVLDKNTKIRKD